MQYIYIYIYSTIIYSLVVVGLSFCIPNLSVYLSGELVQNVACPGWLMLAATWLAAQWLPISKGVTTCTACSPGVRSRPFPLPLATPFTARFSSPEEAPPVVGSMPEVVAKDFPIASNAGLNMDKYTR